MKTEKKNILCYHTNYVPHIEMHLDLTNQRFAKWHQYLPTQNMKQIGRCREIADDPVYLEKLPGHDLLDGFADRSIGFRSGHVRTIIVAQLKKPLQSGR